jgi:hypothetical protein
MGPSVFFETEPLTLSDYLHHFSNQDKIFVERNKNAKLGGLYYITGQNCDSALRMRAGGLLPRYRFSDGKAFW